MFTLETARQLHDSLPEMDFRKLLADEELTRGYLAHFQLDEIGAPWPVSHSLGYFDSLHYRLACQYFKLPAEHCRGTLVLVHGYYDHVGLYRHPIKYCLARGLSVLTFDLPGHGLSGGDPASIDTFDHYSRALVDCLQLARQQGLQGPFHLLAQSTGAATVINCLLKPGEFPLGPIDKIIFLAPLLRPMKWTGGLLAFWTLRWFTRRVKRAFAINSHDEEFLRFLENDDPLQARYLKVDWVRSLRAYLKDFEQAETSPVPLHIVQGTGDTTVDWRYNLPKLIGKFPNARTHMIEGARHHLVNESEEYRSKMFATLDLIFPNQEAKSSNE
jgi:lysophospholipase